MTDYKKVFFDTNPIVYRLEDEEDFGKKVKQLMDIYAESAFATSTVTVTVNGDRHYKPRYRQVLAKSDPVYWDDCEFFTKRGQKFD